jgi:LmbE family N-acetylglucosaminyl deacetylase
VNTHLDEDVCAAGGLIARIAERGAPIRVLALTDSDGASAAHRHAARPRELNRRLANQRLAYERLGARHARHDALALGSGQAGLWVLAPRREDPHPDHAAAATAAAQACQAYRVRLIEYLPTGWPNSTAVPHRRTAWP